MQRRLSTNSIKVPNSNVESAISVHAYSLLYKAYLFESIVQVIIWTSCSVKIFSGPLLTCCQLGASRKKNRLSIQFSLKKMYLIVSFSKPRSFCPGSNVLIYWSNQLQQTKAAQSSNMHTIPSRKIYIYSTVPWLNASLGSVFSATNYANSEGNNICLVRTPNKTKFPITDNLVYESTLKIISTKQSKVQSCDCLKWTVIEIAYVSRCTM